MKIIMDFMNRKEPEAPVSEEGEVLDKENS